jgi:hypothetical protein
MEAEIFNVEDLVINEIVISNAAIQNNTDITHLDISKYAYNVVFSFAPAISRSHKRIRVIFICDISTSTMSSEKVDINGKFEIAYFFSVKDFDRMVKTENDNITLNLSLAASLVNIIYSTSRGVIYTRLQGTIFQKLILPVMSTEKLVDLLVYSENANSD